HSREGPAGTLGDPAASEAESSADRLREDGQPVHRAVPDCRRTYDRSIEPVHGAAAGVPGETVGPHPGGPGGGDGRQPEDRERSVKGLRRGGLRTQAVWTGARRAPKYYAIPLLTVLAGRTPENGARWPLARKQA